MLACLPVCAAVVYTISGPQPCGPEGSPVLPPAPPLTPTDCSLTWQTGPPVKGAGGGAAVIGACVRALVSEMDGKQIYLSSREELGSRSRKAPICHNYHIRVCLELSLWVNKAGGSVHHFLDSGVRLQQTSSLLGGGVFLQLFGLFLCNLDQYESVQKLQEKSTSLSAVLPFLSGGGG